MLGIADRWHMTPHEVLQQPGELLRWLDIERIEKARIAREEVDEDHG